MKLERLVVQGWKSIKDLDLSFGDVNILVGANGAGKSNIISVFHFFRAVVEKRLQEYVKKKGGANRLLYFGVKTTPELFMGARFGRNIYEATWVSTDNNELFFRWELVSFDKKTENWHDNHLQENAWESALEKYDRRYKREIKHYVFDALNRWVVYHFHDTGDQSPLKQSCEVNDNRFLRGNGENLAAFLYLLQERYPANFNAIEELLRQIAPAFHRFKLEPLNLTPHLIQIEWQAKDFDKPFYAADFSDGTLRFLALATVFLQPNPPDTILIDEPELGLHPAALNIFASLIHKVRAQGKQVIIATQSAALLDCFEPEDIIIVDYKDNQTVASRKTTEELKGWLEDYSLGELWEKNVLGGRP